MANPNTLETVLKAVSLTGAGLSWLYTTRSTNLRGKIKTDFEILKMSREALGADHELSQRIEAKLGQMIPHLYRKDSERKGPVRWDDFALGCFCLLGAGTFLIIGFYTANDLYKVLHVIAAGFLAFIAFGAFQNAFLKNRVPR